MSDDRSLDPEAAAAIRRVRRLMMVAGATTFIALAFVLGVIGYRLFNLGESGTPAPPAMAAATLPAGARVLSTAVGDNRIVLTVEVDGAVELHIFDLGTLKPLGRARLAPPP
jgi:hypothetical protein